MVVNLGTKDTIITQINLTEKTQTTSNTAQLYLNSNKYKYN